MKESRKILILRSCQRAEKVVEHEDDGNSNSSLCVWNSSQGFGKETGGIQTIQTTAVLRPVRIFSRVLETWGDMLSPRLHWKNTS